MRAGGGTFRGTDVNGAVLLSFFLADGVAVRGGGGGMCCCWCCCWFPGVVVL